jgi:hypothetical protein
MASDQDIRAIAAYTRELAGAVEILCDALKKAAVPSLDDAAIDRALGLARSAKVNIPRRP